ncbi:hypothetical protein FXO38_33004 [Capsicum annuum]|uniref:VQ domain-containing protein n=1 Tax=Capsicum annuum TaxID=4072 RepID=A0A2G2YTG8_CAPAN|nr:hypothetical protein FXO38_33004 [Capsicum annuum]KAF3639375.1 hypothetical protein FXO37_23984 [Capsicum annuum]PHT73032.1 hypothetical protein T459_23817 [Capsicum annuum]
MSTDKNSRDKVKVVIINTEYIETDARNFKSVVQKLTGKDAAALVPDQNSGHLTMSKFKPNIAYNSIPSSRIDNLLKLELPALDNLFRPYADEINF